MSIRSRFEDAQFLMAHKRFDGALLNICVAIAATSRKRYSRNQIPEDRVCFTKFMHDEIGVLTHGGIGQNLNIKVPGSDKKYYPDNMVPIQDLFYTYVRCTLTHEATLPSNVKFKQEDSDSFSFSIKDDYVELSTTWFEGLEKIVQFAPENAGEFPEVANLPTDVLAWFLFGERREAEIHQVYLAKRAGRLTT